MTGYGVIGLYLSVTLLCGRYTRAIFQYDGAYILFHEYPNVDALLQLCLGEFDLAILEFLNILSRYLLGPLNEIMEIRRRSNGQIDLSLPKSRDYASIYKITTLQAKA